MASEIEKNTFKGCDKPCPLAKAINEAQDLNGGHLGLRIFSGKIVSHAFLDARDVLEDPDIKEQTLLNWEGKSTKEEFDVFVASMACLGCEEELTDSKSDRVYNR